MKLNDKSRKSPKFHLLIITLMIVFLALLNPVESSTYRIKNFKKTNLRLSHNRSSKYKLDERLNLEENKIYFYLEKSNKQYALDLEATLNKEIEELSFIPVTEYSNKQMQKMNEQYHNFFNIKPIQGNKIIYSIDLGEVSKNRKFKSCNFSRISLLNKERVKENKREDGILMAFLRENNNDVKDLRNKNEFGNKIILKIIWNEKQKRNGTFINELGVLLNKKCVDTKEIIMGNENDTNKRIADKIDGKDDAVENSKINDSIINTVSKKNKIINQLDNAISLFKNENYEQKKREILLKEREHIYEAKNKLEKILNLVDVKK